MPISRKPSSPVANGPGGRAADSSAKCTAEPCPLAVPHGYGRAISIEGDEDFREKTIQALDDIKKTPTGAMLLSSIEAIGKTVTIQPTTGGNACSYDEPSSRFAEDDGTAGKGTGATVSFNPDRRVIGSEPWEARPPAIGLAHELIHAEHAAGGTMARGEVRNDERPDPSDPGKFQNANKREVEAVGIASSDSRSYTENRIRGEWDPPQPERQWY